MEIRLHGRGGQGGVTCAKILAAAYAQLGKSVQTFGDYAGERSGAPVRAYTRVSDDPITNRNKVYCPDHLLVLDPTLLSDEAVTGLDVGGTLLLNTSDPLESFDGKLEQFRLAVVDATAIARQHGIGSRSLVIVNTTIAGAYARAHGIPLEVLEQTYERLGFLSNLPAAHEAWDSVRIREARDDPTCAWAVEESARLDGRVVPLTEHLHSRPTGLKTGAWRSQTPRYVENLAPCSAWCPAGNDVIGFIQTLANDGPEAAARVLGQSTPLAGVCGRVCPAPCQEGCNRIELDGAVSIRALERWISDRAPVARPMPETPDTRRRVAVVGGGPAGLSAAYALASGGHAVTIFEGEETLGGVLRTGIPSYRLPRDVLDLEIDNILRLGVEVRTGEFLDRERVLQLECENDAVILATGLQSLRKLDVPGAQLAGVEQGIRFLHRLNMKGEIGSAGHVVVLGGGNTALDCARSALRAGAESVTIAYRRSRVEMPAIKEEINEAADEGIQFRFLSQPVEFQGNGRVEALVLADVELGEPDESGRRRPLLTDRTKELPCDAVLLALGQSADLSLLPEGWELCEGRAFQGESPRDCFAAGDLSTGDGTVTHAIGDGRRAAGLALQMLGDTVSVFKRPDRRTAVPATDIRFDHFARSRPAIERLDAPSERSRTFAPLNHGLSDCNETHRCFSCGQCTECDTCLIYCPEGIIRRGGPGYEVDYTYCKGCGLCVTECPRKAMEMTSL